MQQPIDLGATGAVLDAIRRIVQALRQSSRQAEQDLGLSGAQLFVLRKLAEAGTPLTLSELATRTLTHPSSVSTVVARLTERRFVLRHVPAIDRRRIEVKLSAKGRAFMERATIETAQEKLAQAIGRLSAERRAVLANLLTSVITDAGFAEGEAAMFFEDTTATTPGIASVRKHRQSIPT